jgi:type VI secretion system secreted protein VgrG
MVGVANGATVEQKVTTGLGEGVAKLAAKSPSLQKDLKQLKDDRWNIQYGPEGEGSSTKEKSKPPKIVIDSSLKNDPTIVTQVLAHEVGHATYTKSPDYCSKQGYVKSRLADEGAAVMNNIKVQREIKKNGGPDIGINGKRANHRAYNAAYDKYLRDGNAEAARNAIGSKWGEEIASGTGGKTYNKDLGARYDKPSTRMQGEIWLCNILPPHLRKVMQ